MMTKHFPRSWPNAFIFRLGGLLLALFVAQTPAYAQDQDPLETYNRAIYSFNDTVDKALLKPLAQTYKAVTPEFVDEGVTNFFGNLGDVITLANNLLQFKLDMAAQDSVRIVLNSTFGILGFFDVATPLGIAKNQEDFGQTLGVWGVGEGYYIVLPLLGPSSTRDIWRLPVDYFFTPVTYVDPASDRFIMRGLELIDTRADLLRVERAFGDAALDPYAFQREAYLQRRRNLVFDGNPPSIQINFDEEFEPDAESPATESSPQQNPLPATE